MISAETLKACTQLTVISSVLYMSCVCILMKKRVLTLWRRMPSKHVRRKGPLKRRTTWYHTANSVQKFAGILFTPIHYTSVFSYAAGPLKVSVSVWIQKGPLPLPNLLHNPDLYKSTNCNCVVVAAGVIPFAYKEICLSLHWSPLWVEIYNFKVCHLRCVCN